MRAEGAIILRESNIREWVMSYRFEPQRAVGQSVKRIAASQVDDLLAELCGKGAPAPSAVHEARKTIKRLRALLSLVGQGLDKPDLERERQRLRDIASILAGARDAHVMVETASNLESGNMPRSCQSAARALMVLLEQRRRKADKSASRDVSGLPVDDFKQAQKSLESLPLDQLSFEDVLAGFTKTYHRGRKLAGELAVGGADDEQYHDLRKQVQQHWRHLQLLSNAWPKALRPQVALAHELAETLGKDHDVAVLAAFARDNAEKIGETRGLDSYLRLCVKHQEKLRAHAMLLARRLYAEKPKAICERLRTYWETARDLGRSKNSKSHDARALALTG